LHRRQNGTNEDLFPSLALSPAAGFAATFADEVFFRLCPAPTKKATAAGSASLQIAADTHGIWPEALMLPLPPPVSVS